MLMHHEHVENAAAGEQLYSKVFTDKPRAKPLSRAIYETFKPPTIRKTVVYVVGVPPSTPREPLKAEEYIQMVIDQSYEAIPETVFGRIWSIFRDPKPSNNKLRTKKYTARSSEVQLDLTSVRGPRQLNGLQLLVGFALAPL
jgi:hypothetical protein